MIEKVHYNITKGTIEIYRFRGSTTSYWADVTIDSALGAKAGRISIASDFGSWNYFWGACGETFKKFLAGCDKYYVAKNFGAHQFFDMDATVAQYREVARESFRKNDPDYEKIMHEILFLEQCSGHKQEFITQLQRDCYNLLKMFEGSPDLCYMIDPGFENFWGHIWPLLLEEFKREDNPSTPISIPDGNGGFKQTDIKYQQSPEP